MPDREKIIKRLGKVSYYFKSLLAVGWQGDVDIYREHMESVNMALELLKKQEDDQPGKPIEKHYEVIVHHVWGDEAEVISEFYCPHCATIIVKGKSKHYPRCMWCGKAVKWE